MQRVEHRFVEFVPEQLEPNTLYISMDYATVVHSCLCGCGQRVITPLTPTDWHLAYDGEAVSLSRSIGNWSFPCQSHYWIERNRVHTLDFDTGLPTERRYSRAKVIDMIFFVEGAQ